MYLWLDMILQDLKFVFLPQKQMEVTASISTPRTHQLQGSSGAVRKGWMDTIAQKAIALARGSDYRLSTVQQ